MRPSKAGPAGVVVALLGAMALLAPLAAEALSVNGLSISKNAGNFTDNFSDNGANRVQQASGVAIIIAPGGPVGDTVGATNTFSTRYFSLLAADREAGSGKADTGTLTSDYRVQFTVDVGLGVGYTLTLDTKMFGALTLVTDSNGTGTATVGNVTGKLDGTSQPGLGLATGHSITNASDQNTEINQSNTITLTFTGTRTFTLDFSWTGQALSQQDEAAVRLGFAGTLSETTADDYPGAGPRKATCTTWMALGACQEGGAADGHFLTVLVTITDVPGPPGVPAPASLLLLGLGVVGLGGVAWRRRRG